MSLPFIYKPRPGEEISVSRDADGRCAILVTRGTALASARILAGEAPGFAVEAARAICEAAGKPEPLILDRPEGIDAALSRTDGTFSAGSYAFAVHDGRIDMTGPVHCMDAEEAEFVAGALAACAATARHDEPGPAEVEELAEEIRQAVDARIAEARDGFEIAARAALRWMKSKQQREGGAS